jgi:hypothetical protein
MAVSLAICSASFESRRRSRASVVHVADVRATDLRCCACLAHEAFGDDLRVGELGGEDLDGDALADVHVLGFIDRGHAASADLLGDPELTIEDGSDGNHRGVIR